MENKKSTYLQVIKFQNSVIHNFDLCVIIPFYRRLEIFRKVLPSNAHYLQRNGIEVIILLDSPEEELNLIDLIKEYPFINWKVIVNGNPHGHGNPAQMLNIAIRHATKKYILVSYPEIEFYTDVIFQLRELLEHYPLHYAIGTVAFVEMNDVIHESVTKNLCFSTCGNIMFKINHWDEIGGYDESLEVWGSEDVNIRKRLDMAGIRKLYISEAKSLLREEKSKIKRTFNPYSYISPKSLKRILYPDEIAINAKNWGLEFDRCCYNYQNNVYAEELCIKYLKGFVRYQISDVSIFKTKYKKLILAQSYNELEFLDEFLDDMSKYFDGIILLDDGSTDETYEYAIHDKLLIKVQKVRHDFNDLDNRNILLHIASFFNTEWLCFMDIDERFDERYCNFDNITKHQDVNVINFHFVNIWMI